MINRQQGFTLLEVMAALAIFSMLSVLAFMIFSQASELHQRSQKEIQQFNQLQRTITILDNDLLQLVARRNRSTDKIMVLGEEAIFTTQSRDPLAPLSEAQTLLTVHWYLRNHTLYRAVRTSVDGRKDQPAQAMLEHVESFLLESNSGESQELPLSVTLHLQTQQYGGLQRRFALPEQLAREESPAQTQAGNNNHDNEQRGVALLIVLMLLALMAALAADMTLSFHSQLQRTRQVNHHLQRQYDIELAEKLALASLTQDVKDNDRQTTLQQYWAQPQQLQLEDGNTVKWQLRDAQHCFNLNALAKISDDPLASPDFPAQVFSALLINAGIDRGNTDEIVQSIADYIDVDDSPRFHGAEDNFYQSQTPPRHSANQMLFLTGELRQIKGITENIYQRLIPYVCVLPTTELSINLNMLTENDIPIFRALFLNNITDADARVLLQKRPREGWLTTDAFLYWAQQDFSGVKPLVAQVKGHLFPYSRYFTLSTESISDEQSQGWQSHIFFNRKQQSAQIYRRTLQLY